LKSEHKDKSLQTLCGLFGYSRQAYYKKEKQQIESSLNQEVVIGLIKDIRKRKPRCGTRKLYLELENDFKELKLNIGRDKLFNLLRENNLLIRKRKNYTKTTNSHHWLKKYPNIAKDIVPQRPNQLWVADITYIRTNKGFTYLSLITDAYSRKIVGWDLSDSLSAENAVSALNKALHVETIIGELVHHSDRGIQYCSNQYVNILNKNNVKISMTQNSDPLENAIAERVNGILKDEWINDMKIDDLDDGIRKVRNVIEIYNTDRLHSSIDMLTPVQAHQMVGELKRHWKNYYSVIQKN